MVSRHSLMCSPQNLSKLPGQVDSEDHTFNSQNTRLTWLYGSVGCLERGQGVGAEVELCARVDPLHQVGVGTAANTLVQVQGYRL